MNIRPWRTAGSGATSSAVKGIQYLLRAHGHAVAADGSFGSATQTAVTSFQTAAGVPVDGVVGSVTWAKLVIATHSGSSGDAVRAVQQFGLVSSPGLDPLVVDGSYGPTTAQRVSDLQRAWGLGQDGAAGEEAWSFLSNFAPGGPDLWPLVRPGATQHTNWRVLAAQHLLRGKGYAIAADGSFGPASGAAVNAFQQTLRATYISSTLGQLDWPALIVTVRPGDHGEAVKAVQTLVPGGLTVDGAFGPLTETAVHDYQSMFAPPSDGVVGPRTWHALTQAIFD